MVNSVVSKRCRQLNRQGLVHASSDLSPLARKGSSLWDCVVDNGEYDKEEEHDGVEAEVEAPDEDNLTLLGLHLTHQIDHLRPTCALKNVQKLLKAYSDHK